MSAVAGLSFGQQYSSAQGHRKLPTEDEVRSHLGSLTMTPMAKRPTLDSHDWSHALPLSSVSLGLSFCSSISIGSPLPITVADRPPVLRSGSEVYSPSNNQSLRWVSLYSKLHGWCEEIDRVEVYRIIWALRKAGYIKHGPEATLRAEIAKRKEQFPASPLYLLISTDYAYYLGDTLWGEYRRLQDSGIRKYKGSWEETRLIVSEGEREKCPSNIEQPEPDWASITWGYGSSGLPLECLISSHEFAVIARPQISTRLAYEWAHGLSRGNRSWGISLTYSSYMELSIRPLEEPETLADRAAFSDDPTLRRFSEALDESVSDHHGDPSQAR